MSDNKPIKLKEMVHSLASTMVVTSQFLDQSTVDLQNLYAHSSSGALAALTPPRFTLDEVTIDLSFVVEEVVAVSTPKQQPAPVTEQVEFTPVQRQSLLDRLQKLSEQEASQQQQQQADQNRCQLELRKYKTEFKKFETQRAQFESDWNTAEKARTELKTEIERQQGLVSELVAKARKFSKDKALKRDLALKMKPLEKSIKNLRRMEKEVEQASTEAQAQLTAWERQRPREPANLERQVQATEAPLPPKQPQDYRALWVAFEESYKMLKKAYLEVSEAYKAGRTLPKIGKFTSPAEELKAAMKRSQVAEKTLNKVEEIYTDYRVTQIELGNLASRVAESKGEGIKVRVDPKAIAEAPESARQKIRLTFRSESQENVQLEGHPLDAVK